MKELTQVNLKQLLYYDPTKGVFTWIAPTYKNRIQGKRAGSKHPDGYEHIKINGVRYLSHRLAWLYVTGKWPINQIDHKNRIRNNNRWDNLQEATHQQNQWNRNINKNNKSGITGVHWHKNHNKWIAQIRRKQKLWQVGSYLDFFEACCARKSAENRLYLKP